MHHQLPHVKQHQLVHSPPEPNKISNSCAGLARPPKDPKDSLSPSESCSVITLISCVKRGMLCVYAVQHAAAPAPCRVHVTWINVLKLYRCVDTILTRNTAKMQMKLTDRSTFTTLEARLILDTYSSGFFDPALPRIKSSLTTSRNRE